jgi:hypothetical protein
MSFEWFIICTCLNRSSIVNPTSAPQTTNKKHAEGDKRASDVNTIPCSLTGRMRKPNQQYNDYFVMDVPKGNKLSFLDEQISDTKQGVKLPEKNTTINHESNTMHVSKLPSSSVSSKTVSKTARQGGSSKVTQPTKKTLNSPVSCATGSSSELAMSVYFVHLELLYPDLAVGIHFVLSVLAYRY